jgi:hypothetical protein
MSQVRHVSDPSRLEVVIEQSGIALLIVDLRAKESRDLIEQIQNEWPDVLILALGVAGSEPLREAAGSGIYAAEKLGLERRPFQALAGRAFDQLRLIQENRNLREGSAIVSASERSTGTHLLPQQSGAVSFSLLRFPRVFRRFDNVNLLLGNVVESFADAAGVTRVGIFSRRSQGESYRLRAGLRCLGETYDLEFDERDPLVRWFERRAVVMARANLNQTADLKERTLMRRALDSFGAEAIVPLFARDQILGWVFLGQRLGGRRFIKQKL